MSSEESPPPITAEELVELIQRLGFKARLTPPDDPIYQAGARIRLPLPRARSGESTTPEPESHPTQPPGEATGD